MKPVLLVIFFFIIIVHFTLQAQVQNVIVETYYISDANDATDTTGGKLDSGSTTYRIYINLAKGNKLTKIYGDANHTLKISSTANFFNNIEDGQSFAKDINKSRLTENTVALDTWLTLGQVTKKAAKTYFGILKSQDTDGSFIGGINNDGGSAGIANGLLVNADPSAGIPLTTEDGYATMTDIPTNWLDNGVKNIITGIDSTIFGSVKVGSQFIGNDAFLQNSGVMGVIPDSNQVLVAQLTTKGEISFELNVEVIDSAGNIINYVAKGRDTVVNNIPEKYSPYLSYPPSCGCQNPNYLEYNKSFICGDSTFCKTPVVLGCTDPQACNYNPKANYNIQDLCCYPGLCQDRDISLVCPDLGIEEPSAALGFKIYPNPVEDHLDIQISSHGDKETKYSIYDSFGRMVLEKNIDANLGNRILQVDISNLASGMYLFRLSIAEKSITNLFIKQ